MKLTHIISALIIITTLTPNWSYADDRGEPEFMLCSQKLNDLRDAIHEKAHLGEKDPPPSETEVRLVEIWRELSRRHQAEKARQRKNRHDDLEILNAYVDRMNKIYDEVEDLREKIAKQKAVDLDTNITNLKEYFRLKCSGSWRVSVVKQGCKNEGTELFCTQAFDKYLY